MDTQTQHDRAVLDDPALIGRAADGDLAAFEALMRRHNQQLYRAARSKSVKGNGLIQGGLDHNIARSFLPIKHEPTSKTGIKHTSGTLSIARLAPGSATGEFTIMVGDQPSMDADPTQPDDATHTNLGYAAWGHVVEGMDVVNKILDTPVSPTRTQRGAFKGQMPANPVVITTARRVKP